MYLFKHILSSFLICSFVLFSCKGEVSDVKNKAQAAVESSAEAVTNGVSDIGEKLDEVSDKAIETVSEVGKDISEKVDDAKTIVAPKSSSESVPKSVPTSNSNSAESKIPKPKASTSNVETTENNTNEVGNKNSKVVSSPKVVPASEPTQTKPKPVLKKVEKQSTDVVNEKVEVGKINKPSNGGNTTKIGNAQNKFGHGAFDALLKKTVSNSGAVDYKLLQANQQDLNNYCKLLEDNAPAASWSKNEKLAYWLNAYNAFTLKLIVDNYPLSSIMDLNGGKPWDRKWISLDSKTLSLNDIENNIIRPTFKDARIHFAVNCAAKSCPALANYAFTGRNVDAKMEALTKSFINSSFNEISSSKITISKIFDWYKSDFGDLISFINDYSEVKINPDAKVRYQEYDWRLNGK